MDQQTQPAAAERQFSMPRWEFIAICASTMALNSLAIDIMLPALQQIGESLHVADENHRQFVIPAYFLGMAAALLFYGPASDRFGRRKPLFFGMIVYILAAFGAVFAPSFEWLLAMRFIQGIGAASTRVITVSIVRDRFGGRAMAEVMSLIFMVFMILPVIAPSIGQLVLLFGEWHDIFLVMAGIAILIALWSFFRLPETQHPEDRRPFSVAAITQGFGIVLGNRLSLFYTLATTILFGALFGFINSAQQVYQGIYGLGELFPLVFAGIAGLMAVSNFLNYRLVGRYGMRRLSHGALVSFLVISAVWLLLSLYGPVPFPLFVGLFALAMFMYGCIGSNFNAIAMEPLGHVAGTAASIQGFLQTLGGALIGTLIGQSFDGTVRPLALGFCGVAVAGLAMVLIAERGKLFQVVNSPAPHVLGEP